MRKDKTVQPNKLDHKGRFVIENYSLKDKFSSFLPGVCGKTGIPIWSFYVNSGQAISSFGIKGKENSIMEFYPAHKAYQLTALVGFRTFLKIDEYYYEPFFEDETPKNMYIGMNELEIEEKNEEKELSTKVLYFTLPNEKIGALVRKVTFTNHSDKPMQLQVLDGMPALIPFGVSLEAVKNMGETAKAWMQVEDVKENVPFFRARVSMEDSAVVGEVKGGNFYMAVSQNGELLPAVIDPECIFGNHTALLKPKAFMGKRLDALLNSDQICQNTMPCAFFGTAVRIEPKGTFSLHGIIGHAGSKEALDEYKFKFKKDDYFEEKYQEAVSLTEDICKVIHTKTGYELFDKYCKQTYLDNVLRGGYPILLGEKSIYHIYSRKHGDLERDYNRFCMLPENYSQGNGNFRDINQNRRCDVFFTPYVGDYNIKTFFNLMQLDGYNPLHINGSVYYANQSVVEEILFYTSEPYGLKKLLEVPYTPGKLLGYIAEKQIKLTIGLEEFLEKVIAISTQETSAEFGEGYWTDHWTYNLDLIETYLAIYPEEEKRLLFEDQTYTFFESKAVVNLREKRYVETPNGIRQYHAVDHEIKKHVSSDKVKVQFGKGETYQTNLFTKLMVLAANKFAALDPMGMGIEMEGGKPGWYDALNGLPGIFGSSMAETYELYRMLEFMQTCLDKYNKQLSLPVELITFITQINKQLDSYLEGDLSEFAYWDMINKKKEAYREAVKWGLSGRELEINPRYALGFLDKWMTKLEQGIKNALEYGAGICPTYFAYEAAEYETTKNGTIKIKRFDLVQMPAFLEGPVRFLKMNKFKDYRREIYERVKSSQLYDRKLKMYRVNESLEYASFEVGRAKAFSPGWLENESIWLHMEYKYLLQILKSGLYEEFLSDLQNVCIPFLDAERYGRSILENSSFIASSANLNEKIHGKGFVARLSGATAEFINIWHMMMAGDMPFTLENNELVLEFNPVLPKRLIDHNNQLQYVFLGDVLVQYTFVTAKDIIPGGYKVLRINITYKDGMSILLEGSKIKGTIARDIRGKKTAKIDIVIE